MTLDTLLLSIAVVLLALGTIAAATASFAYAEGTRSGVEKGRRLLLSSAIPPFVLASLLIVISQIIRA